MKKTIEKIKSCFIEKINKIYTPLARLIKKKRGHKSIKLEMKKETLQWTSQKYKGSEDTTTNNYMPRIYKKWINY